MGERQWTVGDEVSGFVLSEVSPLEEYKATGYLFRHIATGMEVYQVVNDDRERFFSYIFRTLPNNDAGIAHILAVLKYMMQGSHIYLSTAVLQAQKNTPFVTLS